MSEQINYTRFKEVSFNSIVYDKGQWRVLKKTKRFGLDPDFRKWVHVGTTEKFLPLSEEGLTKELLQTLYLKRSALDPNTLRTVEKYFKLTRKIIVLDKESNIFLKESQNRVFLTDLTTTTPYQNNHVHEGTKVQFINQTPLTQAELKKLFEDLENPKLVEKPIIAEELQSGEIRLIC